MIKILFFLILSTFTYSNNNEKPLRLAEIEKCEQNYEKLKIDFIYMTPEKHLNF